MEMVKERSSTAITVIKKGLQQQKLIERVKNEKRHRSMLKFLHVISSLLLHNKQ